MVTTRSTVFARTRSGVFKMAAGGDRWTGANKGLPRQPTLDILALAGDPLSPGTVYVGTGTHGIFKSLDDGETWRPINNGLAASGVTLLQAHQKSARGPATPISTLD